MASLQKKGKIWYCQFYHGGRRHTVKIGPVPEAEARKVAEGADLLLLRLKQQLLTLPDGVSVEEYVASGGKAAAQAPPRPSSALGALSGRYLEAHGAGAMEPNSLATARQHLRSFARTLGERFELRTLALADLQKHLDRRRREKKTSPATLRREMTSLRSCWGWAAVNGLVEGVFPNKGLVYPKADEPMPYLTLAEAELRVTAGMTKAQKAELYGSVYLTRRELDEALEAVRARAPAPWVYPLFCFVAHTGARRSEALRAQLADVDLAGRTVLLREKKRNRKRRTTRRVPLSPFLAGVLRQWLAMREPGLLFAGPGGRPISHDVARARFHEALGGGRWQALPGWHVFRHTFISICANRGVDQRVLDEWVGHSTDEQRKRYRHLFPETHQKAIRAAFD